MADVENRLRAAALAVLACAIMLVAHYSLWFGLRLPPTLHPAPVDAALAAGLLVAAVVTFAATASKARRIESQLDAVPPQRGLVPLSVGLGALGEAVPLAITLLGAPCNVHVGALALASGSLASPLLLGLIFPAPSAHGHPWTQVLDEARAEATSLRNAEPAPLSTAPTMERPTFLREVPNPGVTFRDVVGLQGAKQDVAESIRLMADPATARKHGIEPVRGILLHGPPGTGKTFFARAAAGEFGKHFLEVRASDLVSQYVSETEKNIAAAFAYARAVGPCILFFDEIDGLARNRALARNDWEVSRVNALLTEMDGLTKDARAPIVIGATNRIDDLDPAILRPGRFDRKVFVGLPTAGDRGVLLRNLLQGSCLAPQFPMPWLVQATDGMSPAELKAVVQEIRRGIYREGRPTPRPITVGDFQQVLRQTRREIRATATS